MTDRMQEELVAVRRAAWEEVNGFVREYVAGYELRGDVDYKPSEFQRTLILDAIVGLLAQEKFLRVLAALEQRDRLHRILTSGSRPDPSFQFREPGPWWFRSPDLDELEGPYDSRDEALAAYQRFLDAPRRR